MEKRTRWWINEKETNRRSYSPERSFSLPIKHFNFRELGTTMADAAAALRLISISFRAAAFAKFVTFHISFKIKSWMVSFQSRRTWQCQRCSGSPYGFFDGMHGSGAFTTLQNAKHAPCGRCRKTGLERFSHPYSTLYILGFSSFIRFLLCCWFCSFVE